MLERVRKWAQRTQGVKRSVAVNPSTYSKVNVEGRENQRASVGGEITSKITSMSRNEHTSHGNSIDEEDRQPPSRWLKEDFVPHGFADDDGALKQIESPVWRNIYQPGRLSEQSSVNMNEIPTMVHRPHVLKRDTKSLFLLQLFIAGMMVVGVAFVEHNQRPAAKDIHQFVTRVFSTDYTEQIVPTMSELLNKFHFSVPTFGVHAAVYMHAPLEGKINADFSSSHPEIWVDGSADAPVMAAGSGMVIKVVNSSGNSQIEIDHGAIGESIYSGLGSVSVRVHEYVDSGQVIGRLPTGEAKPILRFAMIKNGQFENPHDFIHFPATSS